MTKSLLALVLAGFAVAPAFAEKVGIVDLDIIKQQYTKAVDNAKGLGSAFEGAKAELVARGEKLKGLQAAAEAANKDAENPTLNETARTAKKAEAKAKIEEFLKARQDAAQFEQQAGASFQQRAQQLDREILTEVREKTAAVAKDKGLDIVLPKGAALFSSDSLDISAEVVSRLNAAYAANPVNPSAPAAPAKPAEPAKK